MQAKIEQITFIKWQAISRNGEIIGVFDSRDEAVAITELDNAKAKLRRIRNLYTAVKDAIELRGYRSDFSLHQNETWAKGWGIAVALVSTEYVIAEEGYWVNEVLPKILQRLTDELEDCEVAVDNLQLKVDSYRN